jgi:hypothetical protein
MSVHAIKNSHAHADQRPSASIIYIDPPMARRVLENNTRNRPLSEMHIRRLMDEMTSGRWQYNGDTVRWSNDNILLDGQHRLTALSRLDDSVSLPFLVVRGLLTQSQDTMDQGRSRSAGDQLNIDGLAEGADSKIVAGAIRVYIPWMSGGLFGDAIANRAGNPEVVQWAKDHPIEIALMTEILCNPVRLVKARPSVTLAVLLHFYLLDGEAAREFSAGLFSGAGLGTGNPILTLRDRLDRIRTQGIKMPDRDIIAFFVIAWNAWRSGRSMDKFQRPAGASWSAENFPVAR